MQSTLQDRSAIIENLNQSEIEKSLSNTEVVQRLHPDWRMIPHLPMFGWTEQHQELEDYLNTKIKCGKITSTYFRSDRDYVDTERRLNNSRVQFLGRPMVNTFEGIIEVIEDSKDRINLLPFTVDQVLGRNPESIFNHHALYNMDAALIRFSRSSVSIAAFSGIFLDLVGQLKDSLISLHNEYAYGKRLQLSNACGTFNYPYKFIILKPT